MLIPTRVEESKWIYINMNSSKRVLISILPLIVFYKSMTSHKIEGQKSRKLSECIWIGVHLKEFMSILCLRVLYEIMSSHKMECQEYRELSGAKMILY